MFVDDYAKFHVTLYFCTYQQTEKGTKFLCNALKYHDLDSIFWFEFSHNIEETKLNQGRKAMKNSQ